MINSTGCDQSDLDGVTAMSRQIEGVKIGVTIKEKTKGLFKVSVRTFEPFDASLICAKFGGGGHNRAAGCEFNCSIAEIKEQLTTEIANLFD
jgi:phosphoesterase RecJ-like protein